MQWSIHNVFKGTTRPHQMEGYSKNNPNPLHWAQLFHKVQHGHTNSWVHSSPFKKFIHKWLFECFIYFFSVLKRSFVSFHMVKNRLKGATFQAFFLLLPTKDPCQLRSAFFSEECITHSIPNRGENQLSQDYCFRAVKQDMVKLSSSSSHI